jgi:hypothetical protein
MVAGVIAAMVGVYVGAWLTNRKAAQRDSQPQQLLVLSQQTPPSAPAPRTGAVPPRTLEFGIS